MAVATLGADPAAPAGPHACACAIGGDARTGTGSPAMPAAGRDGEA
jgi:hypothetical protein